MAAREEILKRVTTDDTIREEAARLINDDLVHARHLRTLILEASEQLEASSLKDAVLVMRAAAYSTAIKNTPDVIRHTLRIDSMSESDSESLPELVVTELSQDQIRELQENRSDLASD